LVEHGDRHHTAHKLAWLTVLADRSDDPAKLLTGRLPGLGGVFALGLLEHLHVDSDAVLLRRSVRKLRQNGARAIYGAFLYFLGLDGFFFLLATLDLLDLLKGDGFLIGLPANLAEEVISNLRVVADENEDGRDSLLVRRGL